MKQLTLILTAAVVLFAHNASADCTQRPSSGMFAHTKAPSSVKAATTAPAVNTVKAR